MSNDNYEFQEISNDVAGFWSGEGEIVVRPLHANLCDNGADKLKASVLIICELMADSDACTLDKEELQLVRGETVGVWYKPGMRPILGCAGVTTKIVRDPSKDKKLEGRPLPMTGFRVMTPKGARGKQLQVADDYRRQSVNSPTPFAEPKRRAEGMSQVEDNDEIPF